MSAPLDPLALLERTDKWYLGGGRALVFAPVFPLFLDTPGFWDEAHYADVRLERLFCLLLLDERGRPLHLRRAIRRWTPDRLLQIHTVEGFASLRVQDERVVTPDDTLACRLTLVNTGATPVHLHLIAWSLQPHGALDTATATATDVQQEADVLHFAYRLRDTAPAETPAPVYGWGQRSGRNPASRRKRARTAAPEPAESQSLEPVLYIALGADRPTDSWTVQLAEPTHTAPLWELSVLPEKFQNGRLPQEMRADTGWNPDGLLHLVQHYVLRVPSGGQEAITFGASVALRREDAVAHLRTDVASDVVTQSRENWMRFFQSVPRFQCDDPYLERAYWYRWYGLRLLTVAVNAGRLPCPCVFEGIGAFRAHISYSAQCHMRETAWMQNPGIAMGSLENFLAHQTQGGPEDGFLPGHLYLWRRDRGFYHTDWGGAALQVYALTGDREFVRRIYPGLARYAAYFDRVRDREQSGLYDVMDQGETGQEYMSRYLFVDPAADTWRPLQMKGVDATCYQYSLQRALAVFAALLGLPVEAAQWQEKAQRTREAVRTCMWDEKDRLFKDVHPETGALSPYKAAVGFYPFLTDIGHIEHLGAFRHLTDPGTFGTPYPVPASSVDDPCFDPQAEWKEKRTGCPWNGRVWPMSTWHVIAATARAARTLHAELRPLAADLLLRFLRMLFHDGDSKRPNCYEHYNPYTGMPCLYRGVDDYQHSCVVDLILREVVGVQVEDLLEGTLVLDPLPVPVQWFRVEGLWIQGRQVDVAYDRTTGFTVWVDGEARAHLPERAWVEVNL
ncbi:MAG: trehalase family glycosidase [Chloroherpetonaceae bacterium]|nr:trehalase family glycosidase [Chthonomonadaceae bacterium]MDW8206773.1 trehalase family glycosidase [Chloroherpetonaceae bacterium]